MSSLGIARALLEPRVIHSELKVVSTLQVGPNVDEIQKFDRKGEKTESGFSSDNFKERGTNGLKLTLEELCLLRSCAKSCRKRRICHRWRLVW
jgi:hypothetical protein